MEKQNKKNGGIMNKILALLMCGILTSCTYSITMVHTEGTATDVVDETQTPSTTVSPDITIPAKVI